MANDLLTQVRAKLAFTNPDVDGSEFHDYVINQSVPHMKRNEFSFMYSIADASKGSKWEHARTAPIVEALIECARALEEIEKGGMGSYSGIACASTAREALRKLSEVSK